MGNFDVFISHSSKDKSTIAKGLAKDLANMEYKAWFDSNEIEGSEDWIDEIEQGVDDSSVIVVIWTENAANSKWVKREIARADDKGKPVIPLIFDDTEISSILLQRIQHIDFRSGYFNAFPQLISLLTRLLDDGERSIVTTEGYAWRPAKRPYYRSQFLEENEYLDRHDENFAINSRTAQLIDYNARESAKTFVSVVTVPIPEPIDIDFAKLLKLPNISNSPYQIEYKDSSREYFQWQRFSFAEFQTKHTTLADCLLYKPLPQKQQNSSVESYFYVRFEENGGIEYATSTNIGYFENDGGFSGYVFDLISILGTVWKSIFLACNVYSQFDYEGKGQLLLNLKTTLGSTLAGFANDPTGKRRWTSRDRRDSFMFAFEEGNHGIATDKNLQFVYDFEINSFLKTPALSEDLIVHLSNRLQRAFNWNPANRHYIPETTEFPWDQFYQYHRNSI